jgi:hypothetical protein
MVAHAPPPTPANPIAHRPVRRGPVLSDAPETCGTCDDGQLAPTGRALPRYDDCSGVWCPRYRERPDPAEVSPPDTKAFGT